MKRRIKMMGFLGGITTIFKRKSTDTHTHEEEYTAGGGFKVIATGVFISVIASTGKALFEHVSKKGWF